MSPTAIGKSETRNEASWWFALLLVTIRGQLEKKRMGYKDFIAFKLTVTATLNISGSRTPLMLQPLMQLLLW